MKIVKGKIAEATESELMEYYLKREFDDIMSFIEYKDRCKDAGTKIISGRKKKKERYTVSSYTPEMGWAREYTGYSYNDAVEEYDKCRKIYPEVLLECNGVKVMSYSK